MLSSVSANLIGTFNCLPGGVNASLQLRLGTFTSESWSAPPLPAPANCLCSNCAATVTMAGLPTQFPRGWPSYAYGSPNALQVVVANHGVQDVCLSFVNLTLNAVRVFPSIVHLVPNLASITTASEISITADYINPSQDYACFFNGNPTPFDAIVVNETFATCRSPSSARLKSLTSLSKHIQHTYASNSREGQPLEKTTLVDTIILAPSWAIPSATYNMPSTFNFYAEPTVAGASPNKGKPGDTISVRGTGFVDSQYMSCRFGPLLSPAFFASSSSIECPVPNGISGASNQKLELRVSLNGQDTSSSFVSFQLESSSSWWTSKRVAIVLGSVGGSLLLIGVLVAVILYRRTSASRAPRGYSRLTGSSNSNGYRGLPSLSLNSVVSDEDNGIDMSEVKILEKIGRGSFGDIYRAEWRGTEVAVKKIPFNSINEDLVQEMLNEARIMESIRHPNVLSLMGCCPRPPEVCIIMEYMPRGSLYQILQDSRIPLSWQLIQRMALDAARGMNFLHQHNPIIMHRDLKSHNLLVDDAWRVKVADFGLSRMIEERVSATMTVCGTPCWTAPEVLRNQRYSVKADVYSFGICLWELYSRTAPYAGMTPFQVMFGVASSGMRPPINEDDCPEPWRELMMQCWSESPEDRPTFDQIAKTLQNMVLPETGGFH